MWVREVSQFYKNVSPKNLWTIWTDVNRWTTWHDDLEACKLEGDFCVGTYFTLKPIGAPAVRIELTDIVPMQRFTDRTDFFGAKMYDTHIMEVKEDGVLLTNRLEVTGVLKWLWIKLVAQNVAKTVPADMDRLVALARQKEEE